MNAPGAAVVACVLLLAVVAGGIRMLLRLRRTAREERPRAWRVAVLLLAQAASASLLYFALFPPPRPGEAGTLVVASAHADRADAAGLPPGDRLVALPEAPATSGARRVPDLATALRRHPATARIRVLGEGLPARDRDAARGRALDFRPAPLPRGLVALWAPQRVQAGRRFAVGGRAHDLPGGSAELLDPGGEIVDRVALDADGGFRLAGGTRGAGPVDWRLRLRDRDKAVADEATIPLVVEPGAALRVLVLAGAPNPELKYLRRWAEDAGLDVGVRIDLGAGMQIGDAPAGLDAGKLDELDLVVLDQRAWRSLGDARRSALDRAVRDGLGLLLRLPDRLSAGDRARLRALGFTAATGDAPREARLPGASVANAEDDGAGALPALTRAPQRIAAGDGSPLLADAGGVPLAVWRARGAGRIGVAAFDDSFRLVLGGHGDVHGELWSTLFSTLARARQAPLPHIDGDARAGRRVVLCGVGDGATVVAPEGAALPLYVDPASGPGDCAGFWPRSAGWHVLREPAAAPGGDGREVPFHVRAADDAPGLRSAEIREATLRLAAAGAPARAAAAAVPTPGPRLPWFLAWLLLTAALWWFERSRAGTAVPPP